MFAYCLNHPVGMLDTAGLAACFACYRDDPLEEFFRQLGSGGGGVSAGLSPSADVVVGMAVGAAVVCGAKAIAEAATATQQPEIYSVYFLYARDGDPTTIVYVGRVKSENMSSRMAYHRTQGRELAYSIDGLTYDQCRAIEQGGMIYHHTINRGRKIYNQIRGVGPTNPNRSIYFEAIQSMLSSGTYPMNSWLPASYWENVAENEWLNGCG